jgi:hypothetical protein
VLIPPHRARISLTRVLIPPHRARISLTRVLIPPHRARISPTQVLIPLHRAAHFAYTSVYSDAPVNNALNAVQSSIIDNQLSILPDHLSISQLRFANSYIFAPQWKTFVTSA